MKCFRVANDAPTSRHVAATLAQTAVFWTVFLVALPLLVCLFEGIVPWAPSLHTTLEPGGRIVGAALFAVASGLGLWTGVTMAVRGRGTPLPLATARHLVVTGPYRVIRNPMALAGIAQGVGVGLCCYSVAVILYALTGALLWHVLVRPSEEDFLASRFGDSFAAYRERVPLWLPRLLSGAAERRLALVIAGLGVVLGVHWLIDVLRGPDPEAPRRVFAPVAEAYVLSPLVAGCLLVAALLWTRNASSLKPSPRTT